MRAIPPSQRSAPLRAQLVRMVGAAIVPLALMSGLGLLLLAQHQRRHAETATLDLTRALSIAVDAELQRTVSALEVLATDSALDGPDPAPFAHRAQRVAALQPGWQMVLLVNPDGRMVLNTAYPEGGSLPPLAERESFDRALQLQQPVIGTMARGYRGQFALPVRVPVVRGGRVRYVLTAVFKPQAMSADGLVAVFDARGLRVARSRGPERFIGMPAVPSLQALIDARGDEGIGMTTTLEGQSVHTAYTRSRATGWVVAIGMPPSTVYDGIDASLAAYAAGLLLSLGIGGLVALMVARDRV